MSEPFWNLVFASDAAPTEKRSMRLLKKGGRPFLLLPRNGNLAARCLDLYPAQTSKARLAKFVLKSLLRLGLPAGAQAAPLNLSGKSDFIAFLRSIVKFEGEQIPNFGILAGNPASDSQRFIILLFDRKGIPAAVVKAGVTAPAQGLVQKESAFLASAGGRIGIPRFIQAFSDSKIKAVALPYITGKIPDSLDGKGLRQLLVSWADPKEKVCLRDIACWRALGSSSAQSALKILKPAFEERFVHLTLCHGDFAPWNIKVLPNGDWVAIDWERGELQGIPGWDWFHFLIQPGILVKKLCAPELADAVESLIASTDFQEYASATGIHGGERDLILAYLLHMLHVVRPAEGLEENRSLLELLAARWSR